MYALIDISNQLLEDRAFDHAGASLRKAIRWLAWGVDEASLPSSRTRSAIATWSTLAVSAMRCTVKSYHRKVVVSKRARWLAEPMRLDCEHIVHSDFR